MTSSSQGAPSSIHSPSTSDPGSITEVLVEPGSRQLWVTFNEVQTYRIDLSPLLETETHRVLQLLPCFAQAQISPDRQSIRWPGGAQLDTASIVRAPVGPLAVRPMAVVPSVHRFRPLLPYLLYGEPHTYMRPAPIEPVTVQRLLQLKNGELAQILMALPVSDTVMLNRLYDLGMFLTGHFSEQHLYGLMRHPWRSSAQKYPGDPILRTMLSCLQHGRPDLIERPCMLLATGDN